MSIWRGLFGGRTGRFDLPSIRKSFDEASRDEEHFPTTIDPRIAHVQLLLRTFGELQGKRLLDAGCGKGRFARVLQEASDGTARIAGLDLSEAMLAYLPQGVDGCAGTLTQLPFANGSFDGVYATESLEHAVDIELAVAELCRVLKPGGVVVVIDKNREQWGRLQTSPWERWFGRQELTRLLRRHCASVESQFLSYWEDVPPDGLFLAWIGRK